jgi:predicted phosphoribosyltransferase
MTGRFLNRRDAGRQLAEKLTSYFGDPRVLVLGLPRGGVPVAYEVALALHAPLDVLVVRKLGVPGHRELAMGAIATGGLRVLNQDVIDALGIRPAEVDAVAAKELLELERQQKEYRGGAPLPALDGRTLIVVDDGLATGSTMQAAVGVLWQGHPGRVIVAVPVAAPETARKLRNPIFTQSACGTKISRKPPTRKFAPCWRQGQRCRDRPERVLERSIWPILDKQSSTCRLQFV